MNSRNWRKTRYVRREQGKDPKGHYRKSRACVLSPFGRVQLFVTLWTVARQAPLSMGFSWQEYWSGLLLCPLPGHLSDPEMELAPLTFPALAGRFFTTSATWEAPEDS